MGTVVGSIIGALLGIIATVLVSRYYYQRANRKELGVYNLLASELFSGIDPEVRGQLQFTFRGQNVDQLSQIGLLVANTGERAISSFIEPPRIDLPKGVTLLSASIEFRRPASLKATIRAQESSDGGTSIVLDIPLLNKNDYFVVKLLIEGTVARKHLVVRMVADDLPRELDVDYLPYGATQERSGRVDWGSIAAGIFVLLLSGSLALTLYLLHAARPGLFVLPWSTFDPSLPAVPVHIALATTVLLLLIGLVIGIGVGLGGAFSRGPRFPLPPGIGRGHVFFPGLPLMEPRSRHKEEKEGTGGNDSAA